MDPYILGILWALGRYVDENQSPHYQYFFIRHYKRDFLQTVRQELGLQANIHTVLHKGKTQYRLKVTGMDMENLNRLGWQPRNTAQRGYPRLIAGHRGFIRAYLEIHSKVDTVIIRKRNQNPHKQPRLRIYGNLRFLAELTKILAAEVGTGVKKPQQSTKLSKISGTLYYQSTRELRLLIEYLYRPPVKYFYHEYYEQFSDVLRRFT